MKIIPVLDILNQTIVRGIAGQRETYQPIQSGLTHSSQPLDIAQALQDEFGFSEFYVADLDAILQQRLNLQMYQCLLDAGFTFLLDCGLHFAGDSQPLSKMKGITIVAGLETLESPQELKQLVQNWGAASTVFSLDLKQGKPVRNSSSDNPYAAIDDPLEIAELSLQQGVNQMILLDLANVGTGQGTGTEALCRTLRSHHPDLRLITGGGIHSIDDLQTQAEQGADAVLVASALHDGRLGRDAVLSLS
ncbi:HisA/HisF-related TIM barrel protein [Gimesia maris]|uniref:1-(5-phosphoribosyl)-5-[(5-phosphoribosylamino)methylideneamino] imidazole-4-carboxamide isomerase n=1 Tax=Gimesia maris TaxID=122 RepID=A0ABX5YGW9_9PLAN|nr:HisA/HisF-related TIM barrel protein [Gimesia maris]EDL61686.1 HisA/HisF family protein, putative [Gimesia maris DSM 8797]QEG14924.1 1-(5-phosphoribosyl)-5-[(5-phosphoribosylamino)methylideneamino] imidazole-4-carboxamide isomerase [Gimesia maris]QGQ31697.1 hisA/hisF family protein [Gimesia maris]